MLQTFLYRKGRPLETDLSRPQIFQALADKEGLVWVDLESPDEFESDCLVELFNFHDLAIEDCLNDSSQPKADDYEEYLFLVVHGIRLEADSEEKIKKKLVTVELDIFLGKNYVVTFHKVPSRSVNQVREMVKKKPEAIMGNGADLLVHAILDQQVDHYTPVLDEYEEKIDQIEDDILNNPPGDYLSTVMQIKRDIFNLRRVIAPQRDTINFLTRNPTAFIKTKNRMYFRDIYDHLFRIYGTVEGFHEMITGILQVYFSHSSHKLNEVMKRMTVLATLTMPSLIIASIYGMNFQLMPELTWKYGYFISIGLMAFTSIAMLLWMKFKKWI